MISPEAVRRRLTGRRRARRLASLALVGAALSEAVPLYPLRSLLFADHGPSGAQVSR